MAVPKAKVILLHSRHYIDELLFPRNLQYISLWLPHPPLHFLLCQTCRIWSPEASVAVSVRLTTPNSHPRQSPSPPCSICILILIQQSMPAAPGASARPVKAQLARKWASHTFRVHRPWDGSFAGGEQSELNLLPGALWTPPTHCRYYHCTRQVRDAFTVIANVLYKHQLLFSSFYVNWATESNSTPHIIIIK